MFNDKHTFEDFSRVNLPLIEQTYLYSTTSEDPQIVSINKGSATAGDPVFLYRNPSVSGGTVSNMLNWTINLTVPQLNAYSEWNFDRFKYNYDNFKKNGLGLVFDRLYTAWFGEQNTRYNTPGTTPPEDSKYDVSVINFIRDTRILPKWVDGSTPDAVKKIANIQLYYLDHKTFRETWKFDGIVSHAMINNSESKTFRVRKYGEESVWPLNAFHQQGESMYAYTVVRETQATKVMIAPDLTNFENYTYYKLMLTGEDHLSAKKKSQDEWSDEKKMDFFGGLSMHIIKLIIKKYHDKPFVGDHENFEFMKKAKVKYEKIISHNIEVLAATANQVTPDNVRTAMTAANTLLLSPANPLAMEAYEAFTYAGTDPVLVFRPTQVDNLINGSAHLKELLHPILYYKFFFDFCKRLVNIEFMHDAPIYTYTMSINKFMDDRKYLEYQGVVKKSGKHPRYLTAKECSNKLHVYKEKVQCMVNLL